MTGHDDAEDAESLRVFVPPWFVPVTRALRLCKPLNCSGSSRDHVRRTTFSTEFSTETVSNPYDAYGSPT